MGVEDDEARRALDADVLQHEGGSVVEEAAGEPVLGDLRDPECAVNRPRHHLRTAARADGADGGVGARLEGDEAERVVEAVEPRPVLDRVRSRVRGERGRRERERRREGNE